MNEDYNEQYEDIKRKNRDSMFKPKGKPGKLKAHENNDDFNGE